MRRVRPSAVSSALLFCLVAFAPCHTPWSASGAAGESAAAPPQILILEAYPRALCGDEYFALFNNGASPCNFRGWSISDGEGSVTISSDLWVQQYSSASISFNSTSFRMAFDAEPSISVDDDLGGAVVSGTFRMSDQGDSLSLLSPAGDVVDSLAYGSAGTIDGSWIGDPVPTPRQGEVLRRMRQGSGFRDTDTNRDWMPFREYRYGYTEVEPATSLLPPGSLTAFTCPDSSLEVLMTCIGRAQRSIKLCTYEASSGAICSVLLDALSRGVSVSLLVDGSPAGGIVEEEERFLSVLASMGADVRLINGNLSGDIVQHVGDMHAKYAVIDGQDAVVLSENLVGSAFPRDQLRGNRGWGVLISGTALAGDLEAVFDSDARLTRPDVREWRMDPRFDGDARLAEEGVPSTTSRVIEPLRTTSPCSATLFASPDCSESEPFICSMLRSASSVLGEQFQSDLQWTTRWSSVPCKNPLAVAIASSMRNGSEVRMLFDSSWFNTEGNQATCEYLTAEASSASGDTGFALMASEGPIEVLHNKGFVIDGRYTVVSSNNCVFSSYARNRELALVIDSAEVAAFFAGAFSVDWDGDNTPPVADAGPDVVVHLGEAVSLDGSRSSDDRAVSTWSWDLFADGTEDSSSPGFSFLAVEPGKHEAILTVEDPWGNRATDTVCFTVLPSEAEQRQRLMDRAMLWTLAACAFAGCAVGALIARKFNHGRPD